MLNTKICNHTVTAADNETISEIYTDGNDDVHAFNTKSIDFDLLKDDESDDF